MLICGTNTEVAMNILGQISEYVRKAGQLGIDAQQRIDFFDREYKDDGSVVTDTDRSIEDYLCDKITHLVPGCNCVTEERVRSYRENAELTFVIDPIDGTDNFSNGMHSWCISVGMLDCLLRPIGGIVYAPRLDLLFFADVGKPACVSNSILQPSLPVRKLDKLSGIVMSSRIHQQLDLTGFPGKARAMGTAALHLSMPAAYQGVVGAIQDNKAFAWDIAGAHAVLSSVGCEIRYFDGKALDYSEMKANGWRVRDFIVAGKPGAPDLLMECIRRIS